MKSEIGQKIVNLQLQKDICRVILDQMTLWQKLRKGRFFRKLYEKSQRELAGLIIDYHTVKDD